MSRLRIALFGATFFGAMLITRLVNELEQAQDQLAWLSAKRYEDRDEDRERFLELFEKAGVVEKITPGTVIEHPDEVIPAGPSHFRVVPPA